MKNFMLKNIAPVLALFLSSAFCPLVSSNYDSACSRETKQDQTTSELSDTDSILRRFIIEATVPGRGINCLALDRPPSTAFMLMQLACENEQFAKELKLDDSQLESFDSSWANVDVHKWDFFDVDEATAEPSLYEMLSDNQRKMLELVALNIDGVSSLTRTFFVQRLELAEDQVSAIKKYMAELRSTRVKRAFQSTFGGPSDSTGYGEIVGWENTKVAVMCNQEVIAMLNQQQKERLSQLVVESEKHNELRARIVLEIFYPESKPFGK